VTRKAVFLRGFDQDLDAGIEWYQERGQGLGGAFASAVETGIEAVIGWPEAAAEVREGVRRKWLARFQHALVYRLEADEIIFIGIQHGAQDFQPWLENRPKS
jgi:plasmid stabilization system protein ParE